MTDFRKAYRDRHYESGLCVICPQRATHGDRCRKHWMLQKEYKRKYRVKLSKRRSESGLCLGCGGVLDVEIDDLFETCINCREQRLRPERGGNLR